jgi:hypothetical protein
MNQTTTIRIALGYLALSTGIVGVWATSAPRSFYDDFPGLGQVWIAVDGPYNEHLVRDVGTLSLALTVITVLAMFRPHRALVRIVAVGALVNSVPHFAYHVLTSPDGLSGPERTASLVALASLVAVPVYLIVLTLGKESVDDPRER